MGRTAPNRPVNDELPTLPSAAMHVYGRRYAVDKELGRGGMGRVYRARDLRLQRAVAVKVLAAGGQRDRFEQEARAAGALNHPNIVAVYDVGDHAGEPYLVTELLQGETLREALERGPLAQDQALDLGIQLADGLAAAHKKGIVHRDLKPDNLFVTDEGRLKILDFGIARLAGAGQVRTETGAVMGTPAYMSPEQVRGEKADARSDVFSLGAVLYEMLAGKPPFPGATSLETAYSIVHDAPPPLPESPFASIVTRCLEKDPSARYANGAEVLSALHGTPARRSLRLRRKVVAVAVTALISTLLAAAVVLSRVRGQREARSQQEVIAVFPFAVRGSAQNAYLREGMVDLLSTTLSTGQRRAVDAHALLAAVGREGWADDPARARAVASRLGANLYVLGSIVEAGSRVRIHATLYRESGGSLRDAAVEGEPALLFDLVDDLSARLGAGSASADGKTMQLARLTASPAAIKAYAEGQQEVRRFHIAEAVAAFERALAADPSFALARFQLYRTLEAGGRWARADAEARRTLQVQDRLPAKERMQIRTAGARLRGDRAEAFRLANEAVQAYPEDWGTLQDLFLNLWSWSYLEGKPYGEILRVIDRMLQVGGQDRDTWNLNDSYLVAAEFDRALEVIDEQLEMGTFTEEAIRLRFRYARALLSHDQAARAAILRELPRRIPLAGKGFSPGFAQFFKYAILIPGGIDDAEAIARTAHELDHGVGVDLGLQLDLLRGRLGRARRLARELAALGSASDRWAPFEAKAGARWLHLYSAGFSNAALELGAAPNPAQLAADRRAVAAFAIDPAKDDLFVRVMRTLMLGRFSALLGDAAEAERRAAELESMVGSGNGSIGNDLALWVRATSAWKAGHLEDALHLIERVRAVLPGEQGTFGSRIWISPHLWLPINYGRAELLYQLGRYDEAERWFLTTTRHTALELRPRRFRRLGEIADRRGDRVKATAYLSHFIEMWKDCDPELRPQVDEARARLAALR